MASVWIAIETQTYNISYHAINLFINLFVLILFVQLGRFDDDDTTEWHTIERNKQ